MCFLFDNQSKPLQKQTQTLHLLLLKLFSFYCITQPPFSVAGSPDLNCLMSGTNTRPSPTFSNHICVNNSCDAGLFAESDFHIHSLIINYFFKKKQIEIFFSIPKIVHFLTKSRPAADNRFFFNSGTPNSSIWARISFTSDMVANGVRPRIISYTNMPNAHTSTFVPYAAPLQKKIINNNKVIRIKIKF